MDQVPDHEQRSSGFVQEAQQVCLVMDDFPVAAFQTENR